MKTSPRCIVSVTMQPDLHASLLNACRAADVPLTVWVREAIKARLEQQTSAGTEH